MPVYEVTTESGTYQVETEGAETPAMSTASEVPSIYESPIKALTSADWWLTRPSGEKISAEQAVVGPASRVLDTLTFGLGDEITALGGKGDYESELAKVRQYQQSFQENAPVADIGLSLLTGVKGLPFGSTLKGTDTALKTGAKLAAEGGAYGAAYGLGEGEGDIANRLASAAEGGTVGAVAGPVVGGALLGGAKALSGIGSKMTKTAADLSRKSTGARQSDYQKTANDLGLIDIQEGDLSTLMKASLDDLLSTGKLGNSRNPSDLLKVTTAAEKNISKSIDDVLRGYEKANPKEKVYPTFERALAYLEQGKVPADKVDDYLNRLGKLESQIKKDGQGKLTYLQQQKIAQGRLFDPNDTTLNGFNREIYFDLQKAIESKVPQVSPLNKELQKYKLAKPIFQRGLAQSENQDIIQGAKDLLRTSGGYGVPTLLGGAIGGPAGAALGLGAGTAYQKLINTPEGKATIARALQSAAPGAEKAVSALPAARDVATKGRGGIFSFLSQPIEPKEQPLTGMLGEEAAPSLFSAESPSLFNVPQEEEMKVNPIVSQFEGGQRLKAYEPPAKGSGVTVATGIDLGQRSAKELSDLGLSEALISKVQPYLGKKDDEAKKLLKSKPLSLTQDEADRLDSAIGQKISSEISNKYLKATGQELSQLPEEAQIVLESLAYNFGPNLDTKLPTLWKHITNNDWGKVQEFLVSTKWKQPELKGRRQQEAALLSPLVGDKFNV